MADNATPNKLVRRNQWASFMNTGTSEQETYSLMGDGFTQLAESKNPKEYSRQYVNMATEATDVVGYAPAIAYTVDVYSGDPCIKKIMEITDNEYVGSDAQVSIVNVNLWTGTEGSREATRRKYAVIPDGKGDGTDALVLTGNFKAVGDQEKGTFNETTKTFTPATAAAGTT